MLVALDSDGKPVTLGTVVGRGGEGTVFEVVSDSSRVAKIYHHPLDNFRSEKLSAMVRASAPEIARFAAWPISTLYRRGQPIGFLMRRIDPSGRPIHELYTPKSRLREFPHANWQFLIHVASNIARGFALIHKAGHVIGDINHGNILVTSTGTATFIDCDSFQVRANGRVFRCEVGVPTYTPPELQNRQFTSVERTQNHDAFGLAVLVFHLLFMGRHPFAGRFSGKGDMPIERAIAECRFPFGRLAKLVEMSPPPNSLLLNQVPTVLTDAIERSFSPDAVKGAVRPSALEWISVLDSTKNELAQCKSNRVHVYFSKLASCPWCAIESHGIILFLEVGDALTPGLNIDSLWTKLAALEPLGALSSVPLVQGSQATNVKPTPEWRALGRRRRAYMALGVVMVLGTVWSVIGFNLEGILPIFLVGAAIAVAFRLPRRLQQKRAEGMKAMHELQKRYQELASRYAAECGSQSFTSRVQELERLRGEYRGLPMARQRKLQGLENNKRGIQLQQFLSQFSIRSAKIQNVKDGRKQMLISYGIDSAADVNHLSLEQVPGIGPKLAGHIVAWRIALEGRFRFDPTKAIDKLEIDKIDREIRSQRTELEQAISRGIPEAISIHATIRAHRKAYLDQMAIIARQIIQAEANYKAS